MKLFEKTYGDEDFAQDIADNMYDILQSEEYLGIPCADEYGFKRGTFKVTVTWEDDE